MVFLTLAIDKVTESGDEFIHILTSVLSIIIATRKYFSSKSCLFYYKSSKSISISLFVLVDIGLNHVVKRHYTASCSCTYFWRESSRT